MNTKQSIWKMVRIAGFALVISYAALMFFVFAYFTYHRAPIAGLYAVDRLLIRGPIQRYLHPVTRDDQTIARFNSKRAEFEKLVRLHKERCLIATWTEKPHPEVEYIMQQLGLLRVQTDKSSVWLPDPYSEQSFEKARAMRQESGRKIAEAARAGDSSVRPEIEKQECRYRAAMFYWENFPTDPLAKGLIYFPVDPQVAGGKLHRPAILAPDNPLHYEEVLESLDHVPSSFWRVQRHCKFRRIEPHWFLFVCPI